MDVVCGAAVLVDGGVRIRLTAGEKVEALPGVVGNRGAAVVRAAAVGAAAVVVVCRFKVVIGAKVVFSTIVPL